MLEKEIIQYRGFHNTVVNGKVVGFQFNIRTNYYRGVWLSQIRPGRVIVDGEEYLSDKITWEIDGVEYTFDELAKNNKKFWQMTEPATIKVKKPGGLSQGYHEVKIRFSKSASYMPPAMDHFDDTKEVIGGFGANTFSRKMLIV